MNQSWHHSLPHLWLFACLPERPIWPRVLPLESCDSPTCRRAHGTLDTPPALLLPILATWASFFVRTPVLGNFYTILVVAHLEEPPAGYIPCSSWRRRLHRGHALSPQSHWRLGSSSRDSPESPERPESPPESGGHGFCGLNGPLILIIGM